MSVDNHPKIPTLRAVDHCAYTVPDLDEAVQFFVDHFGAELVFYDGPFLDDESDGMRRRLNVDPRARTIIPRTAVTRLTCRQPRVVEKHAIAATARFVSAIR